MSDEDEEPFVGGPPPDPSERTWRHPSEIAAQANADAARAAAHASGAPSAGGPHRGQRQGQHRSISLIIAGSLGAAACLTAVAISQFGDADDLSPAVAGGVVDITSIVNDPATDLASAAAAERDTILQPDAPTTSAPASSAPTTIQPVSTTRPAAEVERAAEFHTVGVHVGATSVASGVLIDGYVLTSASAVGDQLSVQISHETDELSLAYLVGIDPFSDLAVYRPSLAAHGADAWARLTLEVLDESPESSPTTEPWQAENDAGLVELTRGDDVFVASMSEDGLVIDAGIVIGFDRYGQTVGGQPIVGLIDTTVRRSDTSAGGLLMTGDGSVVGVVADTSSSLASAVPLTSAVQIAQHLTEQGWASETWIGFTGIDLDGGVEVVEVAPGGPADIAGLRAGDVIAFLGGAPIEHMGGITAGLRRAEPGDVIIVVVERAGQFVSLQVTAEAYGAEATLTAPVGG